MLARMRIEPVTLGRTCGAPNAHGRRRRPRGTTHLQGMALLLAELFPCGLLTRDGAVVGGWFTHDAGYLGGMPHVMAAWRGEDGLPAAADLECWRGDFREGIDILSAARKSYARQPGFGHVVGVMDALASGTDAHAGCWSSHGPGRVNPAHRLRTTSYAMESAIKAAMPRTPGLHAAVRAHAAGVGAAMAPFLATLDGDALRECREGALFDVFSKSWDGVDSTFVPAAPLREAARDVPACARFLAGEWEGHRHAILAAGADVSGAALVRHVASVNHGVPPAAVRHWGSLATWKAEAAGGTPAIEAPIWALRALAQSASFPVDWLPRDGDWSDFAQAVHLVLKAANLVSPVDGNGRREGPPPRIGAMLDVRGRWGEWHAALTREAGGPPGQPVRDVADMAEALARQVVVPALRLAGDAGRGGADVVHAAFAALFSGRRLRRMVAMSRRWHAALGSMDAAVAALGGADPRGECWPAVLPDLELGDMVARVLASPGDLADEGASGPDRHGVDGLGHCVRSYARHCRRGASRVVGLRRLDGTRLSTVEFTLGDGVPVASQHRGRDNAVPPPEASAFVEAYLRHVAGTFEGRRVAFPIMPGPEDETECGYDWSRPGAWETVAGLWAPHLPGALRGLTPEGWASVVEATAGLPRWSSEPLGRPWHPPGFDPMPCEARGHEP